MKLPINDILTGLDGAQLFQPAETEGEAPTPITLRTVVQNALLSHQRGDENMDGARKFELYQLAQKTLDPDADYAIEDLAMIKQRVGTGYLPVVVGAVWSVIEGVMPCANMTD